MSYKKSLFIFHRSLRLDDNLGLIQALKDSEYVIPIFIFTPEQVTSQNKYKSDSAIMFMIQSLIDLGLELKKHKSKLFTFYGSQHMILDKILKADTDIEAVYCNTDYTPYAVNREEQLQKTTEDLDREFISVEDYLLHPVDTIKTGSGTFYSVFTPFYRTAVKLNVDKPKMLKTFNFITSKYHIRNEMKIDQILKKHIDIDIVDLYDFIPSREEALHRIELIKYQKKYADDRNSLYLETTKLSPYIKFGLVSIREVYHKILKLYGKAHDLIKQLYWREFYYCLSYNRPDILKDGTSFRESYDKINWYDSANDKKLLKLWKQGLTGYPVIDAGIRELNLTGYMHNRTRLITSNFLVKHLFIDWREGEKYFACKLIDYDPNVNNGNWQFTSGSGADSQPYFRMMNPWLQQQTHDQMCTYIKTWIPELADVPPDDIHNWQETSEQWIKNGIKYPAPCKKYEFNTLKKESKKVYSKAF
jgi:deoxyribodipyrimidine photo-lyase